MIRIGHGYDAHKFSSGNEIILGGVTIPHSHAIQAHSDGDVVLHALCDALLGAAALGDIGQHFPDTDSAYENIDSRILLRKVYAKLTSQNYHLGNADITIIAEKPRLAAHLPDMKKHIAADLSSDLAMVNIKATTTEGLGFAGRKEGIAVHAVVTIVADSA